MQLFSSTVIAAAITTFFFLFNHSLYLWKTATKENLPLAHLACSRPYVEYIPNSYILFIPRRYYTFAEHKETVTFDLDVVLSEMNEESTLGGFHYSATLNAEELAAVRAAPGVSHVECKRHLKLPPPLEDAPWIAPLRPRCDASEDEAVLKSYLVHLYSGYPLQDHKKKVASRGFHLDAAIKLVHPPSKYDELSYSADSDEETLAAVRKDVGVVVVECQPEIQNVGWEVQQGVVYGEPSFPN